MAGAFGVKGEIRIASFTIEPAALVGFGPLLDEKGKPVLKLARGRAQKGALIAAADPPVTREAARAMAGLRLYVRRTALPAAAEEEFYVVDLVGLEARDPTGAPLGRIRSVQDFGAGDLLEIAPEIGASWWTPFTRAAVPEVRIQDGYVVISPSPPGA